MTDVPTGSARRDSGSTYLFWAALALPAVVMVLAGLSGVRFAYNNVTGMVAGVFLGATLLVTPLQRLVGPGMRFRRNLRRHLGVAAFGYTLLHMAVWLARSSPEGVLKSFLRPEILTGWLAFFVMVPLAVTSTDAFVRSMGPRWKILHRWAYVAAVLTLAHWFLAGVWMKTLVLIAVPLLALDLWRFLRHRNRMVR